MWGCGDVGICCRVRECVVSSTLALISRLPAYGSEIECLSNRSRPVVYVSAVCEWEVAARGVQGLLRVAPGTFLTAFPQVFFRHFCALRRRKTTQQCLGPTYTATAVTASVVVVVLLPLVVSVLFHPQLYLKQNTRTQFQALKNMEYVPVCQAAFFHRKSAGRYRCCTPGYYFVCVGGFAWYNVACG